MHYIIQFNSTVIHSVQQLENDLSILELTDFYGPFMTEHTYESCVNSTGLQISDMSSKSDYRVKTQQQINKVHLRGGKDEYED